MHSKTLGTVAIWLVGGAALAGDPPADFPPPALPPLSENVPPPLQGRRAITTQELTPYSKVSPYFVVGKLAPLDGRPTTPPQYSAESPYFATGKLTAVESRPTAAPAYAEESPYFAVSKLTAVESRPTTGPQNLPLQSLPGIVGSTPADATLRDLRAMPDPGASVGAVTPYYGMAAPAPAATCAPAVLNGSAMAHVDEGYGRYLFGSVDYLLFKVRRGPAPELVQTIPPEIVPATLASGDLPPGAATTIFGGSIDQGAFSGVRAQLGVWLNDAATVGVDGSYLHLFEQSTGFSIRSEGVPVIGRGFSDVSDGRTAFLVYALPDGTERGFINVNAPTEMYTADLNLRVRGTTIFSDRLDVLWGLRYLKLRESINIDSGVVLADPTGGPPTSITSQESFRTENNFYGSQMGLESHFHYGCFTLDLSGKLAMGWVHEEVGISGSTQVATPGLPTNVLANRSILFVQPTNAGNYERNRFAVLPEFLVKLGYQITPHVRATVGYDLLVLSNVMRPGAAIDEGVNPANTDFIAVRTPSDARRPAFSFSNSDFWAQGLTAGIVVTY